jgi:hypothetical protein
MDTEVDEEVGLVSRGCGCVLYRKTPRWRPIPEWEYLHRCLRHSVQ